MKKASFYFIALIAAFCVACDPVEDREGMGGPVFTPEQVDVTAAPIVVNSKNSNKIVVKNNSPVLGRWVIDTKVMSVKSTDTLLVGKTGINRITFEGRNPDGSSFDKELEVTVDELIFD